jgi:hypothetical protein
MNPNFPLYIVSKGRYESRLTSKALESMRVPYFVVIEEQEFPLYAAVIDRRKLLILDKQYQRDYDTFDDLGETKSKGPGAARNFAWDHAIANGHDWHWVMDDNIGCWFRMNRNAHVPAADGTLFRIMEDFCLRFTNVAMAGPDYYMFVKRKFPKAPLVLNTRIYSCNLIRNDVPFRWRGRYNEDTDLSLRMLKAGWCTVQFEAFQQNKMSTQTVKGGCDRDFYSVEGTKPKSQMLVKMHPDVARLTYKFHRWHHEVDYRPFKTNRLILKPDVQIAEGVNEYGLFTFRLNDKRMQNLARIRERRTCRHAEKS